MKTKDFAELKQKTTVELDTDLNKKKSELFNLALPAGDRSAAQHRSDQRLQA